MSQIQLLFPVLSSIYIQKFTIAIAIVGLIHNTDYIRNIKLVFSNKIGSILIFLIIWIFLSVPLGVYPGHSVTFLTSNYWKLLVVLCLLLGYVNSLERFNKLIWVYILSVGFLALVTLKGAPADRVAISNDVYDPNDTALQFLLAIPFAFWKFKSLFGTRKVIAAAICVLLIVGMVKTGSRGGFLGLVFITGVIVLHLKSIERKGMFKAFVLLICLGTVIYYQADPEYIERISTITNPSEDYNLTSSTGRVEIWKRGINMMFTNPFLGVGVDNFITADGILFSSKGARYNAAHNSFVQVGAELGIPGLLAFCLLIWNCIKSARQIFLKNNMTIEQQINNDWQQTEVFVEPVPLADKFKHLNAYAIVASWIGFCVSGSFLSAAYTSSFYFLLGLSMTYIYLELQVQQDNEQETVAS